MFLFNLKFEIYQPKTSFGLILIIGCQDKKNLHEPTCDITCIFSIIQNGGQFMAFRQNISRVKQDVKIL